MAQEPSVIGDPGASLLLTDLYQLPMLLSYLKHGMTDIAVFGFFERKLPERRGFLIAAGPEQTVDFPWAGALHRGGTGAAGGQQALPARGAARESR